MPEDRPHTQSRNRREARTIALKTLFEADLTPHTVETIVARYGDDDSIEQVQRDYASRIVNGVIDQQQAIDDQISRAAPAFPVDQLAAVDRNVLRIAIYELRNEHKVPYKAVINEAVEIAKQFGGENSGRFVNGVLGTIAAELTSSGELSQ